MSKTQRVTPEDKERVNAVLRVTHEIVARHKFDRRQIKFDGEAPPDGEFDKLVAKWEAMAASPRTLSRDDIVRVQTQLFEQKFKPAEGTPNGQWNKYWKDALAAVLDLAHRNYEAAHPAD